MFTGIVEEIGKIIKKNLKNQAIEWEIKTNSTFMQDVKIGDSISVAGICQTVTALTINSFSFYSSHNTLKVTTIAQYNIYHDVNLEKALLVGQRLGGHFVYGHIEDTGNIVQVIQNYETITMVLLIPKKLQLLLVETGSITIDGVSLTVSQYVFPHVTLNIIPHTWKNTTLQLLKPGSSVNIETDPLAKYVLQAINQNNSSSQEENFKNTLMREGFLK